METRLCMLVVVSATVAFVQGKDVCSPKFPVNTGHYCFKYIEEKLTYSAATARCNQMGAVVAHPAAQDWETWRQDVRAVTRNDHTMWVGTTRNSSSWYWLNTRYDGQPIDIDYNLRKQGDISIPKIAWSSWAQTECKQKMVNGSIVNGTMVNGTMVNGTLANSTSTDGSEGEESLSCDNDTAFCAVFGKNGKLRDRDCGHEAHYVLCQGPMDYSSSCEGDQHCTENAYNLPISFNLCGCKCRDDYIGDGYVECIGWTDNIDPILPMAMFGIVVGSLLSFICCFLGVRKQMITKSTLEKNAVKKTWSVPAIGFAAGLLIIFVCL